MLLEQPKITIVIFGYNEQSTYKEVIEECLITFSKANLNYEILVIDDGSTDNSVNIISTMIKAHSVIRFIKHNVNQGLGFVYREGFAEALGDYICFLPADGQFYPLDIVNFMQYHNEYDLILGCFNPKLRDAKSRVFSALQKTLYNILFGTLPKFQGIFLANTRAIKSLNLSSNGSSWTIVYEMIIKARDSKLKILSLETNFRNRRYGSSKVISFRKLITNFFQIIQLKIKIH